MSVSMIERVARAINDAGRKYIDERLSAEGWADVPDEVFARAAIEAMREPTDAMWDAGQGFVQSEDAYQAMIDAALNEQVAG